MSSTPRRGDGVSLVSAVGIAAGAGGLYTSDLGLKAVVRVAPDTGQRTVVSGPGVGAGPALVAPFDLELEADGSIVVADTGRNAVLRIDPRTGDRAVVSDFSDARLGPVGLTLLSVAVAGDGRLMVLDRGEEQVVAVDPVSGVRRVFSGADQPGPRFKSPIDLSIAANGDLLVADPDAKSIYRVDRGSGARSLLSCSKEESRQGEGEAFGEPVGVVEMDDGDFLVGDLGRQMVLRVTPCGDRSVYSSDALGGGPSIELLMSITRDAGGRVFLVERENDAVVEVLGDGERRTTSVADAAHVSHFLQPYDITRDEDSNLLVMDRGRGAIVRVKARSGVAEVACELGSADGSRSRSFGLDVLEDGTVLYTDYVHHCVRSADGAVVSPEKVEGGPDLSVPGGIDHFPDGRLVVVEMSAPLRMFEIDGAKRRVITGGGVGEGPEFEKIFGVRVGPKGFLWTCDMGLSALIRVDPETGERVIISGQGVGSGPGFRRPLGLDIDSDGTVFIADFARNAVLEVNPETGARRVVSDNVQALGEPLTMPISVAVKSRHRLAVTDLSAGAVYWVDRRTGARTLLSAD